MTKETYTILSPDGFPIGREPYATLKEAEKELTEWIKRYEAQGYYSSNNGRIPLTELRSKCKII